MVHRNSFVYTGINFCIKIVEKPEEEYNPKAKGEMEKDEEAKEEPGQEEQKETYDEKKKNEKQIGKNDECTYDGNTKINYFLIHNISEQIVYCCLLNFILL